MTKPILTILVTGATGQQGGAVAHELLHQGHHVRALTRNSDSPAAHQLKKQGAIAFAGDFNDQSSLEQAADGADAIYAMATPFESGVATETGQASAIANAAKTVGCPHLVYSSVASANQNTGIPHFDSKFSVEQHIQQLDTPYTIIAPVFFMDNFLSPFTLPGLQEGKLMQALPADRRLQAVAVRDIAAFTSHVMDNREEFLGRRIDIAGDEMTGQQYADAISLASGRSITYVETSLDDMRAMSEDMAHMYEWFDSTGYHTDIATLRRDYPDVGWHTFPEWASEQNWSAIAQIASVSST